MKPSLHGQFAADGTFLMHSAAMNSNPPLLAIFQADAMFTAWAAGWWSGRVPDPADPQESSTIFNDAVLALLGLLRAFTFSMSVVHHEGRREMAVADSNTLGDFYTRVSLLNDPVRTRLRRLLRDYVEHRLSLARMRVDERTLQQKIDEIRQMHGEMQLNAKEAVDRGTVTVIVVPLVHTLNELTSSRAWRLAVVRDRLPPSIVTLLFVAAVLLMAVMGRQQKVTGEWHSGATFGFNLLVALVIWVTMNLNGPQQGGMTVRQEPLEQLLEGMETDGD